MMIPILKDYYDPGYLPDAKPGSIAPYLTNVNLAVRKKVFEDIGEYDEACEAGEDADFCIRAASAGWAQFFSSEAEAYHEPRKSLTALLRQWVWYGKGGSHFFFKQQRKGLEVFLDLGLSPKLHEYRRLLAIQFWPIPAMLFVSGFFIGHLFLLAGIVAAVLGFRGSALAASALALFPPIFLYRKSSLRNLKFKELLLYAGIGYLINWTCIFSSCIAGIKRKRIFLYPGI